LCAFALVILLNMSKTKNLVPKNYANKEKIPPAYDYIKPLIAWWTIRNVSFPELNPLKNIISAYISQAEKSGEAEDVSGLLSRYEYGKMDRGEWKDLYAPSSMLKVGILMAYLKIAVTDPDVLNEMLYTHQQMISGQFFKPKQTFRWRIQCQRLVSANDWTIGQWCFNSSQ